MKREAEAGFTLIETIVALIILAGGLLAFYSFLSTALAAAGRAQAVSIEFDRRMNALEIATALNPMASPEGKVDLGSYSIAWSSTPIADPQQGSAYPLGKGIFKIGLYKVTFTFPGTRVPAVEVTRMGYSRDNVTNPFAATVN
jgi:general secretion pathway protein I